MMVAAPRTPEPSERVHALSSLDEMTPLLSTRQVAPTLEQRCAKTKMMEGIKVSGLEENSTPSTAPRAPWAPISMTPCNALLAMEAPPTQPMATGEVCNAPPTTQPSPTANEPCNSPPVESIASAVLENEFVSGSLKRSPGASFAQLNAAVKEVGYAKTNRNGAEKVLREACHAVKAEMEGLKKENKTKHYCQVKLAEAQKTLQDKCSASDPADEIAGNLKGKSHEAELEYEYAKIEAERLKEVENTCTRRKAESAARTTDADEQVSKAQAAEEKAREQVKHARAAMRASKSPQEFDGQEVHELEIILKNRMRDTNEKTEIAAHTRDEHSKRAIEELKAKDLVREGRQLASKCKRAVSDAKGEYDLAEKEASSAKKKVKHATDTVMRWTEDVETTEKTIESKKEYLATEVEWLNSSRDELKSREQQLAAAEQCEKQARLGRTFSKSEAAGDLISESYDAEEDASKLLGSEKWQQLACHGQSDLPFESEKPIRSSRLSRLHVDFRPDLGHR